MPDWYRTVRQGASTPGGRVRLPGSTPGDRPSLRTSRAVVVSEDVRQPGREHHVAVFPPFALFHADGHALAVDRGGRQADRLRNPQTCGVADGQDHAVLEALDSVEKSGDLIWAHYDGKCLRPAAGWDDVVDVPSSLERDLVKKGDGGHRHTHRTGCKLPVPGQIELEGADLGWA